MPSKTTIFLMRGNIGYKSLDWSNFQTIKRPKTVEIFQWCYRPKMNLSVSQLRQMHRLLDVNKTYNDNEQKFELYSYNFYQFRKTDNFLISDQNIRNFSYLWPSSVANSYIQPSLASHFLQVTSRTMCLPVSIIRSWVSLENQRNQTMDTIVHHILIMLNSKARTSEEMDGSLTQLTMSVFVGRTQNISKLALPL